MNVCFSIERKWACPGMSPGGLWAPIPLPPPCCEKLHDMHDSLRCIFSLFFYSIERRDLTGDHRQMRTRGPLPQKWFANTVFMQIANAAQMIVTCKLQTDTIASTIGLLHAHTSVANMACAMISEKWQNWKERKRSLKKVECCKRSQTGSAVLEQWSPESPQLHQGLGVSHWANFSRFKLNFDEVWPLFDSLTIKKFLLNKMVCNN